MYGSNQLVNLQCHCTCDKPTVQMVCKVVHENCGQGLRTELQLINSQC
jgi:hypothetical protein